MYTRLGGWGWLWGLAKGARVVASEGMKVCIGVLVSLAAKAIPEAWPGVI